MVIFYEQLWTSVSLLWNCLWPKSKSHIAVGFLRLCTLLALRYNRARALYFAIFEVVRSYSEKACLCKLSVLLSTFLEEQNCYRNAEKKKRVFRRQYCRIDACHCCVFNTQVDNHFLFFVPKEGRHKYLAIHAFNWCPNDSIDISWLWSLAQLYVRLLPVTHTPHPCPSLNGHRK